MENKLATVPPEATQAGETTSRWTWTEPSVWTERMLTALEQGVKGGKWFSLIDKVHSADNLYSAATKVAANQGAAGVDHITTKEFFDQANELSQQVLFGAMKTAVKCGERLACRNENESLQAKTLRQSRKIDLGDLAHVSRAAECRG